MPIASIREPLTSRWPWRRRNKGGGRIWDRKSIPTACAWALSRIGIPAGTPATKKCGDLVVEDYNLRKYLKKTLYSAGIPKIEIERDNAKIKIYLHCARPGVVIGKGGTEIERLRLELEKKLGKPVALNIVEVKSPDTNAQLVAENIAQQLEKRIAFRRAMKNAMGRAMRSGAQRHQGHVLRPSGLAPRSPATSAITTAPSPCRPSAPTSSTASLRQPPPMAASA